MLCRLEERDPRKCLKEGKLVTACGVEFYRKLKKTCRDELELFSRCTEFKSWELAVWP